MKEQRYLDLPMQADLQNSQLLEIELHHTGRAHSPYPDISTNRSTTGPSHKRLSASGSTISEGGRIRDQSPKLGYILSTSSGEGISPRSQGLQNSQQVEKYVSVTEPIENHPQALSADNSCTDYDANDSAASLTSRADARHIRRAPNSVNTGVSIANGVHDFVDVADPEWWTADRINAWLDANGFGAAWHESFALHSIKGASFLALTSYPRVKRVIPQSLQSNEAGIRLCNTIRKMLVRPGNNKSPLELEIDEQDCSITRPYTENSHFTRKSLRSWEPLLVTASQKLHRSHTHVAPTETSNIDHRKARSADKILEHVLPAANVYSDERGAHNMNEKSMLAPKSPAVKQRIDNLAPDTSEHKLSNRKSGSDTGAGHLDLPEILKPRLSESQRLRRFVQVTTDHINYVAIEIGNINPGGLRTRLATALGLSNTANIYVTEIGAPQHGNSLRDDELLQACSCADFSASIKFYVTPELLPVGKSQHIIKSSSIYHPQSDSSDDGRQSNARNIAQNDCLSRHEDAYDDFTTRPFPTSLKEALRPEASIGVDAIKLDPSLETPFMRTTSQRIASIEPTESRDTRGGFEMHPKTGFSQVADSSVIHGDHGDHGDRHSCKAKDRHHFDEGFRVIRFPREIDFDTPRSSPYNSFMKVAQDADGIGKQLRGDNVGPLIAHRNAPKRPEGVPEARIQKTLSQAKLNDLVRERSRRKQSTRHEIAASIPKDLTLATEPRRFVFSDAPAFEQQDDSDEEDVIWAVRPHSTSSRQASPKAADLESPSPSPEASRKMKHQSMKSRKTSSSNPSNYSRQPITLTEQSATPISDSPQALTSRPDSDKESSNDSREKFSVHLSDPEERAINNTQTNLNVGPHVRSNSSDRDQNASSRQVWAVRPPTELVYENLQDYFPDHDLDKPIIQESPNTMSGARNTAALRGSRNNRMKSIRIVASEANEARKKFQHLAHGVRAINLLRRRSTKVWGSRAVEVTPSRLAKETSIASDIDEGVRRTPTFKWLKGELIGKGQFGHVYLAMNISTGDMLAVKQVEIPQKMSEVLTEQRDAILENLNAEIETMRDLDHVNIVQYLGYERTERELSIFLEYVPGGSIGGCLRRHGKFEEDVIRSLTRQTLEGLQYLHQRGILHRDLKADNLLLDRHGTCKISDFGISKRSHDVYGNDANMSMQGTIFWMAPEVIQNKKQGYSAKIDIWSLGCLVLEMFAGRRPWSSEEAISVLYTLGKGTPPPIPADVILGEEARHFLDRCFIIEPSERPTAHELLLHPFCKVSDSFTFSNTMIGQKLGD